LAPMDRSVSRRRSLDRSGQTITHHVEGFDLRANRRDPRRGHDLASRAPRGRKELGLPLLLAAGRHLHALGLDASGILRGSTGMARLAHSCGRRQSAPVQIMYGVGGERWLPELIVPWLPGYENSAPVRIGNDASRQLQLDVFGEIADAMFQGLKAGMPPSERGQAMRSVIFDF